MKTPRPQLVTDIIADDEERLLRAARSKAVKERTGVHAVHDTESMNTVNTERESANSSLFVAQSVNAWLTAAASKPIAKKLCGNLWAEGELVILFADTGLGKSVFAMQVSNAIGGGPAIESLEMEALPQSVLYFDFELTDMQLQRRYAVEKRDAGGVWYGEQYQFSERFRRVEIDAAARVFDTFKNWEDLLKNEIEQLIVADGSKVIVFDNITYLASETDKGRSALPLMQRLNELKKQQGLSIMVLAHTPKRLETSTISINDLAGAKILSNFADGVFAIGGSHKDAGLRYIKQLKARSTELLYSTENVAVFRFEKTHNFLGFEFLERASEYSHLKPISDDDKTQLVARVKALSAEGNTQRKIANELGLSVGTVNKYLKKPDVHTVHDVHAVNTVNTMNSVTKPANDREKVRI